EIVPRKSARAQQGSRPRAARSRPGRTEEPSRAWTRSASASPGGAPLPPWLRPADGQSQPDQDPRTAVQQVLGITLRATPPCDCAAAEATLRPLAASARGGNLGGERVVRGSRTPPAGAGGVCLCSACLYRGAAGEPLSQFFSICFLA